MKRLPSFAFAAMLFPTALLAGDPQKSPPPDPPPISIPKYPEPEAVFASMKKAASFFRSNLSVAGGYAWSWPRDLSDARGEHGTSPALIVIQPPGTPTVGRAMLHAYLATGDPLFLQGAKEAAQALIWCQYASGGWGAEHSFALQTARRHHFRRDIDAGDLDPGTRKRSSSLDDDKTQSAISFLMELANTPACSDDPALRHALDFAWDGLLAAQSPNGGWPQQFSGPADPNEPIKRATYPEKWSRIFPGIDYAGHYTLNDNNLVHLMELLLDAHEIKEAHESRFLDAAKRLGDFLLLAQFPEPQPVWAQQYDREMHPAWARKFEPPALASVESFGAIRALHELWIATGEDKYRATLPAAIAWFERSKIKEDTWARFYEMKTNKPLYCKAGTYGVTYDDSDLPTHYGFKVTGSFVDSIGKMKVDLSKSRDEILIKQKSDEPNSEKSWSEKARKLASKVRGALNEQKEEGYWVKGDSIDAGEFVTHIEIMSSYFEAAKKAGDIFRELRERNR